MEQLLIGTYIRQKRLDKGWTQEKLCRGVCNAATLSRIENNERMPSVSVVKALLQKLGLPDGQFFALLGKDDIAIEKLQKDILNDNLQLRRAAQPQRAEIRERILEKLEKLENLGGEDNRFVQQFVGSARASAGRRDGPYSYEERLEMLLEAIRLTIPRFDVKNIADFQYSLIEIIIVNQIALTYAKHGDRKKATPIFRRLLQYIERYNRNLDKYPGQFCMVAHNCAINFAAEKQYPESVALAEKGQRVCVETGDYQFLPGFLAIQAECHFFLGNMEKSIDFYNQAYYLYKALGDNVNLAIITREMMEHFGSGPSR